MAHPTRIGTSAGVSRDSRYDDVLGALDPAFAEHLLAREGGDARWHALATVKPEPTVGPPGAPVPLPPGQVPKPKTFGLVGGYRDLGHLLAHVDPLSTPPDWHPLLDPSHYGLGPDDLTRACEGGGFLGDPASTLADLIAALRETYCGTLGVEYTGIRDPEQRLWLQERMEPRHNRPQLDTADRLEIYRRLAQAELFEQFLQTKYPTQKRFGIEGGETLIPLLWATVEECARADIEQIVVGMAHRGRLNVLGNIVGKPLEMILAEFEGSSLPDWVLGDGDVKYHQGYSRDFHARGGRTVHISLTPNPSHLEAVNPVVEGKVRAKQNLLGDLDRLRVMPLLIHGDAAFVGQGIVPETLLLTHLAGHFTGGTIHVVHNNQIGFTTPPESARPTRYATDMARVIESPVFHVNSDDPEMAVHVARLALGFRQRFRKDVVIDLVCFRRHGHNELDDPTFTQPAMVRRIATHPGALALYERKLIADGVLDPAAAKTILGEVKEILDLALEYAREFRPRQEVHTFGDSWQGLGPAEADRSAATAVPADRLLEIAERAACPPEGFDIHPKAQKVYAQRLDAIRQGRGIDFGGAEMLALGSLLREGTAVRLSGQDVGRGTFSHRHAVLHDQQSGETFVPLNAIAGSGHAQARIEIIDSMLSEEAVLGFEYGYASAAPRQLTIWEAQFGDFANGAQNIIDTFIAAGESKWQRSSGLVMLLPHGYEGQGPEHSSGRIERYLQLCADDNLQVIQPSCAAQLFHALRRQMHRGFRKPLITFSPKSLLRLAPASSMLAELTAGVFQPVLSDPVALDAPRVRTVALCSGRVFYDLARARQDRAALEVALVRVEELYPFPADALRTALAAYPDAHDLVWVQDEPENMGAWSWVAPRIRASLGTGHTLRYAGRDEAASPATGSHALHAREQQALLARAFEGGPVSAEVAARATTRDDTERNAGKPTAPLRRARSNR